MEAQRFVSKNDRVEKADRKKDPPWAQGSGGAGVKFGSMIL